MQNNIFRITTTISQNVIRCYGRKAMYRKKTANPGIDKRIRILEEKDETNLEQIDVEELESDFMKLGDVHRQHEKEVKYSKDKEKYWIIRQKYFKENKVNFLTWSDKEQIRYLHETNPSEWTIHRLSEGFPALPETITKIIKAKWQTSTENKKFNHDKAVERNWKLLREGKLSNHLPDNLLIHLMKFSSRKQATIMSSHKFIVNTSEETQETQKKTGEFASIIESYNQLNKHKPSLEDTDRNVVADNNRYMQLGSGGQTVDNQLVTLNQLRRNIDKDMLAGKSVNKQDEMLLLKEETTSSSVQQYSDVHHVIGNKHNVKTELVVTVDKKNKMDQLVTYPERIQIPKDKYNKGSTYKVNDCYYDDDGEFLYRVPGMY